MSCPKMKDEFTLESNILSQESCNDSMGKAKNCRNKIDAVGYRTESVYSMPYGIAYKRVGFVL